jgi:hypothetical protein
MKTNAEPTFVQTSNVGETKRATIKTSAKLFNFLSGQIYSNKYTAIWRELVANGIDAQRITKNATPPIVTVPSMLEPHAKVRDFGTGMSHEFMMDKFMAFADASTKDDSNEFIGGFGIGSKAPLSYTDQYSIKCFQRGTVRVYSVFKDDEGCPSIAFLSEAATDEPDGVEVGFPVRLDDVTKFTDVVQETLQYFNPLPVLENTDLKLMPVKYDAHGKKWGLKLTGGGRNPKVIVGGVAYPLDANKIPYDYKVLRGFIGLGLDIYMDIGEVEIALSREHVTQDEVLHEKLNIITAGIGKEFGKQLSASFANCTTKWEAQTKLAESLEAADYNSAQTIRKYAQWRGADITPKVERQDAFDVLVICYGSWGYNKGPSGMNITEAMNPKFRSWPQFGNFPVNAFDRIVIDNSLDKPALRIRTILDTYKQERILFLRDNSEKRDIVWDDYLKAIGSPPKAMIDYTANHKPAVLPKAVASGGALRPFKCYINQKSVPYRGSPSSDTLPSDGGLYIVMDNFSVSHNNNDIEIAKMTKPKNVVYLNKTDFESSNIQKNPLWYSVTEGIEKVKLDYKTKNKSLALAEAYWQWSSSNMGGRIADNFLKLAQCPNFPKRGPLAKLWDLRNRFTSVNDRYHSKIRVGLMGVTCDKELIQIQALASDVAVKHPLIVEVTKDNYTFSKLSANIINRLF